MIETPRSSTMALRIWATFALYGKSGAWRPQGYETPSGGGIDMASWVYNWCNRFWYPDETTPRPGLDEVKSLYGKGESLSPASKQAARASIVAFSEWFERNPVPAPQIDTGEALAGEIQRFARRISLTEAAMIIGISLRGCSWAAKNGRLSAWKGPDNDWVTTVGDAVRYRRTYGRKQRKRKSA